ncbi:MAG: hypothetical protein MJZ75_03595 [Paludibacteraceae bacterium]|nr:hypothetical protein [Paludibacteraceae bacterium]
MLVQIIATISEDMKLNMTDLHIQTNNQLFDCQIEVLVYSEESAETLCTKLRAIEGLTFVERIQQTLNT